MYPKAEILFPYTVIPHLKNLRGEKWAELVDRVSKLPETDPDALAFILMMIRINSCLKCYSGSYKFMRGCRACSTQGVMQFKGEDEDLVALYEKTRGELLSYMEGDGPPPQGFLEIPEPEPTLEPIPELDPEPIPASEPEPESER